MARTTATLVRGIITTRSSADLTPFIDTASLHVTDVVVAGCTAAGITYSDEKLELIERWLAAHYYCMMDPRTDAEKIDVLQEYYESTVDLGLDVSRYGQQAMRIDTAGFLAANNNAQKKVMTQLPGSLKKPVQLKWLGTCPTGEP